jgi:hypothetical protein
MVLGGGRRWEGDWEKRRRQLNSKSNSNRAPKFEPLYTYIRISHLHLRFYFSSNSNPSLIYLPTSNQFTFLFTSYTWTPHVNN